MSSNFTPATSFKRLPSSNFSNTSTGIFRISAARSSFVLGIFSCFSRNVAESYAIIYQLRKLGIEPQAIEQPLDMSIPESKIMLAIYLAAPEVENDRRALNVIAGMRKAMIGGRHVNMAPKG